MPLDLSVLDLSVDKTNIDTIVESFIKQYDTLVLLHKEQGFDHISSRLMEPIFRRIAVNAQTYEAERLREIVRSKRVI